MDVKIKKLHPNAVIPAYAKPGDAGMDLTAVSFEYDEHGNMVYGTGLAFEIPEGYVGLIFPRSSISECEMIMANSVGVIDSGFRGEVKVKFKPSLGMLPGLGCSFHPKDPSRRNVGERVAQMIIIPYPHIKFIETDTLSKTERGDGGYGHTGK